MNPERYTLMTFLAWLRFNPMVFAALVAGEATVNDVLNEYEKARAKMSGKVEIEDVQAYVEAFEKMTLTVPVSFDGNMLFVGACILAAADRIASAEWSVGEAIEDMNHPSAE